jgi:hypothetical protein
MGKPRKRPCGAPLRQPSIGTVGSIHRCVAIKADDCVHRRIERLDLVEVGLHHLTSGQFASPRAVARSRAVRKTSSPVTWLLIDSWTECTSIPVDRGVSWQMPAHPGQCQLCRERDGRQRLGAEGGRDCWRPAAP